MSSNDLYYMSCQTGCVVNGKLYVIDRFFPMLLRYDISDFSYEILSYSTVPEEFLKQGIASIIFYDDTFFFFSRKESGHVVIFDPKTNSYREILDECESVDKTSYKYVQRKDDIVYCFSAFASDPFRRFALKERRFVDAVYFDVSSPDSVGRDTFWRFICDEGILDFAYKGNRVSVFSETGEELRRYNIEGLRSIENVAAWNDQFYITSHSDQILRVWNEKEGIRDKYEVNAIPRNSGFPVDIWSIFVGRKYIICTPVEGELISMLNQESGQERVVDLSGHVRQVQGFNRRFFNSGLVIDDKLLLLPEVADSFVQVDMRSGEITATVSRLRDDDVEAGQYIQRYKRNSGQIVKETGDLSLKVFLRGVSYIN